MQHFALMIAGSPAVMRLSVDLHEDLVQVPPPLRDLPQESGSLHSNLVGEHWTEPVDPEPDVCVADIYPSLIQQVFDVPERERKSNVHHCSQLDDLGRRFEVAKRVLAHF